MQTIMGVSIETKSQERVGYSARTGVTVVTADSGQRAAGRGGWACLLPAARCSLKPQIPVVPLLSPEISGLHVRIPDRPDPLDVLHPVLHRDGQTQRRAVLPRQRGAVQLVRQQRLRVQHAL